MESSSISDSGSGFKKIEGYFSAEYCEKVKRLKLKSELKVVVGALLIVSLTLYARKRRISEIEETKEGKKIVGLNNFFITVVLNWSESAFQ